MKQWLRPVERGWVVLGEPPGPDVDEFAEPERIRAALARTERPETSLLAVQHPHLLRTTGPAENTLTVDRAAIARAARALHQLQATHYRSVRDVVGVMRIHGEYGLVHGLLCLADPGAVGPSGQGRVRSSEQTYPEVVRSRAALLAGLGVASSAALLLPMRRGPELAAALLHASSGLGEPQVSGADPAGRRHEMWLIGPGERQQALLNAVSGEPGESVLVADGNHRVAAAARAGLGGMLAMLAPAEQVHIGPIHRVLCAVASPAVGSVEALVMAARDAGWSAASVPTRRRPAPGEVIAVLPDGAASITLPAPEGEGELVIDHALVESRLLPEVLGLAPGDPVLQPWTGSDSQCPAGAAALLRLAPVTWDQVLASHGSGVRLPRKSTLFTPKPRSGLLLAELTPPPTHQAPAALAARHNMGSTSIGGRAGGVEQLRGVIAMDGPSGTGKSTVSRRLAAEVGAGYLDTGAMYRLLTLGALLEGLEPRSLVARGRHGELAAALEAYRVRISLDPQRVELDLLRGEEVVLPEGEAAERIRGAEVTAAVSAVASVPALRSRLVSQQRELIAGRVWQENTASHGDAHGSGGIVVEGRDIATAVAPDAALKIYLTADAEVRAARRSDQEAAQGREASVGATLAEVQRRDAYDSARAVDPLQRSGDAVTLDSSGMGIDQVVQRIRELAAQRGILHPEEVGAP